MIIVVSSRINVFEVTNFVYNNLSTIHQQTINNLSTFYQQFVNNGQQFVNNWQQILLCGHSNTKNICKFGLCILMKPSGNTDNAVLWWQNIQDNIKVFLKHFQKFVPIYRLTYNKYCVSTIIFSCRMMWSWVIFGTGSFCVLVSVFGPAWQTMSNAVSQILT